MDQDVENPSIGSKSSVLMASVNMCKSIVGAGIVGLPFAMSRVGLVAGLFLLVAIVGVVGWTLLVLADCMQRSGAKSYAELVRAGFGEIGAALAAAFQIVFSMGAMIAYTIIAADMMVPLLAAVFPDLSPGLNRTALIIFLKLVLVLPLSLFKSLSKMAAISALSLFAIAVVVVTVMIKLLLSDKALDQTEPKWRLAVWA